MMNAFARAVGVIRELLDENPVALTVVGQGGMEPRCRYCDGHDWAPINGRPGFVHAPGCWWVRAGAVVARAQRKAMGKPK